jgi:hypothetical protein
MTSFCGEVTKEMNREKMFVTALDDGASPGLSVRGKV